MKNVVRILIFCLPMAALLAGCGKKEAVINSVEDAKEKKIGVMTGSIGEALAYKKFPQAEIKSFDDIMDAVAAIKSGQLDAIITMFPAALQVSKKNQDLRILPERLENEDTAVAVRKDNEALLADVDRIISELKQDGTLESMNRRWLKPDLTPYEEMDIAVPAKGNVLRIGVSATREPFSFVDENGRVTGFDGELARIIGARLNRPVEFLNMKFMALIPALQSGKVDMIISGMNATPERRKQVSFSQTYFANAQVMLARKQAGAADKPATPVASPAPASVGDELSQFQQAEGKRIGVMIGTTGEMTAVARFPKADIKRFDDIADAVAALRAGQLEAVVNSYSGVVLLLRKYPEFRALPDQLLAEDIAIATRKDSRELLGSINRIIAEFKADGTLDSMGKRWLKQDETPYEEVDIPAPAGGKALKIGVCAASSLSFSWTRMAG